MWLSGIGGHGAGGLIPSKEALLSHHECVLSQVGTPLPTGLVSQLRSTSSYLTGPLVSSSCSGVTIVAVQWPVPFSMCVSSNYPVTRTPHTNICGTINVLFMFYHVGSTSRHTSNLWGMKETLFPALYQKRIKIYVKINEFLSFSINC